MYIKKDDIVKVISGKDKGKTGKVLSAQPKKNRVVVEGINIVKKHVKPSQTNPQGGVLEVEAPIYAAKVALVDKNGKATRIGYKFENGKKIRVAKTTGEEI